MKKKECTKLNRYMKARHKDTGEIIELTEEGIISCNGRKYCWHQVELLPEPVDVVQPSLPSNLDEAAEEYGRNTFINECMKYGVCDGHDLSDAFKAGAEWMAGQGYTKEETVYFERLCDENRIMVDLGWGEPERGGFNPGDKVIVQIRKKQ